MLTDYPVVRSAARVGSYVVVLAIVVGLTAWSALRVGTTTVGMLDAKIIDGSGRAPPEPDWTAPALPVDPREAEATTIEPATMAQQSTSETASESGQVAPLRVSSDNPGGDDPAADFVSSARGMFKTYCVRLCDGYYFPISFATTPDRFVSDADACHSACGSPARLFVHAIPGGGPGTMVSLDGLPYTSLKSAFLFRTKYDAQCRCQPQPWDEASRDKHRLLAAAAAAAKGDRQAAAEASALTKKMTEELRTETAARDAADEAATHELDELAATAPIQPPKRVAHRPRVETTSTAATIRLEDRESEPSRRGGFMPASGSSRNWVERVFGEN